MLSPISFAVSTLTISSITTSDEIQWNYLPPSNGLQASRNSAKAFVSQLSLEILVLCCL